MDGKLQENDEVNYPYYKWVAHLPKLYPIAHSLMGQREHPTFRHPSKTQIVREYRLP